MNRGADETGRPHRSIGEVVDILAAEFPDITISKVRFLEGEGLVVPDRAPSGYRRYRERDIAQLRWVLRLQRDHFLPLRIIRERLSAGEFTGTDDTDRPVAVPRVDPTLPADDTIELTGKEIVERTGLSVDHLAELERFGLVDPASRRGRPVYSGDDLIAAQLVARFLDHGVEPRHLRPFKVAAEREAGLIEQRLSGLSGAAAEQELGGLVRLGGDLRALLLRRLLHS